MIFKKCVFFQMESSFNDKMEALKLETINTSFGPQKVLTMKDANVPETADTTDALSCAFCKKTEPMKRCSKRHPKCLKKMFCNDACESRSHENKKGNSAKKEPAKVAKKKAPRDKKWKDQYYM